MSFNEKLIELRKKEGLSQEELGYKLNVTRQTVSKWELGQTTPEMDKLTEISKLFNISMVKNSSDRVVMKRYYDSKLKHANVLVTDDEFVGITYKNLETINDLLKENKLVIKM